VPARRRSSDKAQRATLPRRIRDGKVERVRLSIFEPPRFFEALLRGRGYGEVLDIVARICGICPIAYQMSGVHAIEDALWIVVDPPTRVLRRLLYCGEWIESHALHIVMLHAPDFLGYPDGIAMARDHPDAVQRGLALKKAGNELLTLLGGRAIHPVNVRVGGFYRVPSRGEFAPVVESLKHARDLAIATLRWAATFSFPDFTHDYEFVALRHPDEYPMNAGRIVSSAGLDIAAADYETEFIQRQVPYSTALHSLLGRRGVYLVGPMARYALNRDRLPAEVRALADEAGLGPTCRNPFRSILVRAVEVVYACGEALRDRRLRAAGAGLRAGRAAGRRRLCLHRGAAGHPLSPLPARCRGSRRRRPPRSADLAEPGRNRRGLAAGRNGGSRSRRGRAESRLRAEYPQP